LHDTTPFAVVAPKKPGKIDDRIIVFAGLPSLRRPVASEVSLAMLTIAPVLLKGSSHGLIGGIGGTEAAVKWRFLDEATSGFVSPDQPTALIGYFGMQFVY
jgi:hypothetical protein